MNSSKTFDGVIRYIEGTISTGGEIDFGEISRIALCPAALFQRIFIFVAGISISDYARKRRLTLAGKELKNGGISVLDAAIKYGFQSHSAFSRAFREHHGVTPSQAKLKTAVLKDYPPINFSEMRFAGGKRIMAEMKRIVYKEAEERLMAGLRRETSFYDAGKVWREFFTGGACEKLGEIPQNARCCGDIDEAEGIGLMYGFEGRGNFTLIIGDFVKVGTEIPDGFFARRIPKGLAAHIQIEGESVAEIIESAYFLITEAIEKTDRKIDFGNFYWCEVYTKERFGERQKRGEKVIIDYIMPVTC